jgi:hypothetical protein
MARFPPTTRNWRVSHSRSLYLGKRRTPLPSTLARIGRYLHSTFPPTNHSPWRRGMSAR